MPTLQEKFAGYVGAFIFSRFAVKTRTKASVPDRLKLYEALSENPLSPERLAEATGTELDPVREWLGRQATRGHIQYDATSQRFWISADQASALSREPGLCFVREGFDVWRSGRLLPR